jgi:hypothetical protein
MRSTSVLAVYGMALRWRIPCASVWVGHEAALP